MEKDGKASLLMAYLSVFCYSDTEAAALVVQFLDDLSFSVSLSYGGTVVIAVRYGTEGTWNQGQCCLSRDLTVLQGKCGLGDHGILIFGIPVSSEAEISQTVDDVFTIISIDSLKHMGMTAYHQISPPVDAFTAQFGLVAVGNMTAFRPPVAAGQDQRNLLLLQLLDAALEKSFHPGSVSKIPTCSS